MVANAEVKFASLAFRLFRNMYLAGTFTFYCFSAISFDSNKRDNHFWWGTSEFSDLIQSITSASHQRFSLDSYNIISDSHLRCVFSIGSHPSFEGIRRSARLRFSTRFLDRFGYHTSISRTELQL